MKLSRIKMFAGVLALALTSTFGMAQTDQAAAPAPSAHMHRAYMHGGPMMPFFAKQLELTDAQKTQIKEIFHGAKPAMQPLMEQEHQSRKAMMALITSGNFDQAKAQSIINQESLVHAQMEMQHAQLASKAYQVLTPEQKTKFNDLMAQHEQRMEQRKMQHQQDAPEQAPNQ